MDNKKQEEEKLFGLWHKDQENKTHFQNLYNSMKPLIHDAAKKAAFGSNLPESAHRLYAAQAFLDSIKTYKPGSAASIQTHVYGSVQNKVKRLNYEYQNLGKMPEPRAVMVGQFINEFGNLRANLGRDPSTAELSDHIGMPMKQVANLQKELRKDLSMDAGTDEVSFMEGSKEEEFLNYLYYELSAEEKVVYEYITGHFGKPRMVKGNNKIDYAGIATKMGVSESKIRLLHNQIRKKYNKALK